MPTASCAALTISGTSSVAPSPPDVALTATPLGILEPDDDRANKQSRC